MLKIKQVSYCYASREEATLKNIELEIASGEMVLIAGRTGCGKSTLIKVINGLLAANSKGQFEGSVTIDELDIRQLTPEELGLMVGSVYQSPDDQLFAMTVYDEVAFILENQGIEESLIRAAVQDTLRLVGLEGFEERGIHALSGGQRQRLALASVLVNKPKILILDEPVSQMNPSGVVEFLELLKNLNRTEGMTIIVVEHRVHELAKYFPRLIVMNEGRIIFDGDINRAWKAVGDYEKYGLREPQNVQLCRSLGLEELELETERAVRQIRAHCVLHSERVVPVKHRDYLSAPVLEGKKLAFAYSGTTKNVLGNLDFSVYPGEIVALMGYNGAGKSTLLNMIAGLTEPTGGELLLLGGTVAKNAHRLAFLRQDPDLMLLADTVQKEIMWQNELVSPNEADELLNKLDLYDKRADFPLALSKGQRLRVVLASLLARKPELILLDEPTTGQDQQSLLDIKKLLMDFTIQGGSALFCTHDVELAADIADRVFIMNEGRIEVAGDPLTVFTETDILREAGLTCPPMLAMSKSLDLPPCVTIQEVKNYVDEAVVGGL